MNQHNREFLQMNQLALVTMDQLNLLLQEESVIITMEYQHNDTLEILDSIPANTYYLTVIDSNGCTRRYVL